MRIFLAIVGVIFLLIGFIKILCWAKAFLWGAILLIIGALIINLSDEITP